MIKIPFFLVIAILIALGVTMFFVGFKAAIFVSVLILLVLGVYLFYLYKKIKED